MAFSVQNVSNNLLRYISFRPQNGLCPVDHRTRSVSTSRVFGWSAAQVSVLKELHCTAKNQNSTKQQNCSVLVTQTIPLQDNKLTPLLALERTFFSNLCDSLEGGGWRRVNKSSDCHSDHGGGDECVSPSGEQ